MVHLYCVICGTEVHNEQGKACTIKCVVASNGEHNFSQIYSFPPLEMPAPTIPKEEPKTAQRLLESAAILTTEVVSTDHSRVPPLVGQAAEDSVRKGFLHGMRFYRARFFKP